MARLGVVFRESTWTGIILCLSVVWVFFAKKIDVFPSFLQQHFCFGILWGSAGSQGIQGSGEGICQEQEHPLLFHGPEEWWGEQWDWLWERLNLAPASWESMEQRPESFGNVFLRKGNLQPQDFLTQCSIPTKLWQLKCIPLSFQRKRWSMAHCSIHGREVWEDAPNQTHPFWVPKYSKNPHFLSH